MSNKGETAYLTGGASGIGRAVTEMLVKRGIKVFVADSDIQGLRKLGRELNVDPQNPVVWTAEVDVSEWDSQIRAFKTAEACFRGRIDYVFPIAGISERRSFPNKPKATGDYERPDTSVLDVNMVGVVYTVSLAVQHFRREGARAEGGVKGRIVAVASVCGFYIHIPLPLYTAAKHAVVGFTRSFGKVLEEEKIQFNSVCPNKIRTNIGSQESYDDYEKVGVVVPMDVLTEAFEKLLPGGEYANLAGECIEVAPKAGLRVVPKMEFWNEESKLSAELTYGRSHFLHEVVE